MKQSIVRRTESLLNDIQTNIQRGDVESAAISLCHAYSLAPRRTKKQLRRIDGEALKSIVKFLEKFCTENKQDFSLSAKKISELILLSEVDPNNSVAWRVRLLALLESEEYEEVVLNTDRLESMPITNETADMYLMCSLAHMRAGVKETGIELYMRAFNTDADRASKCLSKIGEDSKDVIYNTFLEKASQLHKNMMSLSAKDNVDMLNYYGEILKLQPNDVKSAEVYGQLLMKVGLC